MASPFDWAKPNVMYDRVFSLRQCLSFYGDATSLTTWRAMFETDDVDRTRPELSRTDWRSTPKRGITRNRSFFSLFDQNCRLQVTFLFQARRRYL